MTSHLATGTAAAKNFAPATAGEPRFAIYYTTPASHPLTRAAETWLGRSAFHRLPDVRIKNDGDDQDALIGEPRRYGFHATLKAPFRLADGIGTEELEAALSRFAGCTRPCPIGPLRVGLLAGFFALIPIQPIIRVRTFSASVVEAFDRFRAPFDTAELKRRKLDRLDNDEAEHLVRWGYPYVFDRFRFHMTLTNPVGSNDRAALQADLAGRFDGLLDEDFAIDALTLFEQPHPQADFVARRRFPLNPGAPL